jgi:hypothetical protein
VLIVKANGDRFTGKIIAPGSNVMEWPLIEPRFDGEKFITGHMIYLVYEHRRLKTNQSRSQ